MSQKPLRNRNLRFSRRLWPAKPASLRKPWRKSKARFNRKLWPVKPASLRKPWRKSKARFNKKLWPVKPALWLKPWRNRNLRFSRRLWPAKPASLPKRWRKSKTRNCPTLSTLSAKNKCRRRKRWLKRFQTKKRMSKFLTAQRRRPNRRPLRNNPPNLFGSLNPLNSPKRKKRKSGTFRKWICPLLRKGWKKPTLRLRQSPPKNRKRMNSGGTDTPNRLRPLTKRHLITYRNPKPHRTLTRRRKRIIRNCTGMSPREITARILIRTKTAIKFTMIRIPPTKTKTARHTTSTQTERPIIWMKTAIRIMWTKTARACTLNPLIRRRLKLMRMKTAIRIIWTRTARPIIWMRTAPRTIWMRTVRRIMSMRTGCRIIWMKTARRTIWMQTGFLIT